MSKRAFAVAAHPDDIEFMMSGTLMLLKDAGYEVHYMNIANGSCGTDKDDAETVIAKRRQEAMNAAQFIGAVFHESLVNDIEIFYDRHTLLRLGSIMREVAPEIILTHSPYEYMEDHSIACRLTVTAAFCRGMKNLPVDPPHTVVNEEVTIYHALPYGLRDPLRRLVRPGIFVDVTDVVERKKAMLGLHKSQKEWLDVSQGMDSYLKAMVDICREVGKMSCRYEYAEGWRRHLHHGLCAADRDPLMQTLTEKAYLDKAYEKELG